MSQETKITVKASTEKYECRCMELSMEICLVLNFLWISAERMPLEDFLNYRLKWRTCINKMIREYEKYVKEKRRG